MFFKSQEKFSRARLLGWAGVGWDALAIFALSAPLAAFALSVRVDAETLMIAALLIAGAFRCVARISRARLLDEVENLPHFFVNAMERNEFTHSPRLNEQERQTLFANTLHLHSRLVERRSELRQEIAYRRFWCWLAGSSFMLVAVLHAVAAVRLALTAVDAVETAAAFGGPAGGFALAAVATLLSLWGAIDLFVMAPRAMRNILRLYEETDAEELVARYFLRATSGRQMSDRAVLAMGDHVLGAGGRSLKQALETWRRPGLTRR